MRYRLRTLFILTTVVAALMALGNEVRLRRELARQTLFTDCFRSLSGVRVVTSRWDKYRFVWDPYAWLASLNGFSYGTVDESEEWVRLRHEQESLTHRAASFLPHDARTTAVRSGLFGSRTSHSRISSRRGNPATGWRSADDPGTSKCWKTGNVVRLSVSIPERSGRGKWGKKSKRFIPWSHLVRKGGGGDEPRPVTMLQWTRLKAA